MNKWLLIFLLLLCLSLFANAEEKSRQSGIEENTAEYFLQMHSLKGPTGFIYNPSAEVLAPKNYSLGIHIHIVKGSYGLLPNLEVGGSVEEMKEKIVPHLNVKYKFPRQLKYLVEFAGGITDEEIYVVGQKNFLNLLPWGGQINVAEGIRFDWKILSPFMDIAGNYQSVMWLVEYSNQRLNLGCRILLSPRVKLDLFLIDLGSSTPFDFSNFTFGVGISRKWGGGKNGN